MVNRKNNNNNKVRRGGGNYNETNFKLELLFVFLIIMAVIMILAATGVF